MEKISLGYNKNKMAVEYESIAENTKQKDNAVCSIANIPLISHRREIRCILASVAPVDPGDERQLLSPVDNLWVWFVQHFFQLVKKD